MKIPSKCGDHSDEMSHSSAWAVLGSLCQTLCEPVDCGPPDSSVRGISQATRPGGYREWGDVPISRGSSQPRDRTQVSCVADGFLTI